MTDFVMPILGADMEEGTLVEWRKAVGDEIRRGDVIAEVETDKGLTEVEAFVDGMLEEIVVGPGTTVPVGTVLARIRTIRSTGETTATVTASEPRSADGEAHVRASPAARRLAAQLGVELSSLRGTGPEGAIQSADVERAAAEASAKPKEAAVSPSAEQRKQRMRQTIAAAMSRSKREIPHYYLATTADAHPATTWIAAQNAARAPGERLLAAVLFVKAVALALREVPELNSVWEEGRGVPRDRINVGVAIALRGGGLVAPAIHDTDTLAVDELMRRFRDLVLRARSGALRSSEYSDPTITVTSLGDQGVESLFGVIYPPQVAIVGFGRVVERPWSVGGAVVSRPVVTITLSADHRVSDGHRGALFLAAVDRLLQTPEAL
ncbi:MAG: 2-oxo acid dehydrogenase subunit E2 [Deltaproteobacteria bacterium]|nr:2-oxo acid dehydrogenase subunit E2 [Deltaproteobacteria bacterium]